MKDSKMDYRITKFDPKKRNAEGHFLDDSEWTSISDIGKAICNNLSYEEYERIESAYVAAVILILDEKAIPNLRIVGLESYNTIKGFDEFKKDGRLRNIDVAFNSEIAPLENGTILSRVEIQKMTRLILRETIWMYLCNADFKITFGYDYYMYVDCAELADSTIKRIEGMGLFVEPGVGRRRIIVIDENGNEI